MRKLHPDISVSSREKNGRKSCKHKIHEKKRANTKNYIKKEVAIKKNIKKILPSTFLPSTLDISSSTLDILPSTLNILP